MNFVRRVFSNSLTARTLPINETAVPLHYALLSFRWHMDSRPTSKAILVHDLFGSSVFWQQLLQDELSRLPLAQLTPKLPLELYAVDLRGHNHSAGLPFQADGVRYTSESAADIVLHQKQVVRGNAHLVGIGFGALVACLAALHSPQSGFDSLTLFVDDSSQLVNCDSSRYLLPSIISGVPKDIKSLFELDKHLKNTLPNVFERALIFASAEERNCAVKFRFSDELLRHNNIIYKLPDVENGVTFDKRVVVVQCGGESFSQSVKKSFTEHFPSANFVSFEGCREMGLSSLYSQKAAFARTFLEAMDMLGKVEEENYQ